MAALSFGRDYSTLVFVKLRVAIFCALVLYVRKKGLAYLTNVGM